MTNTATPDTFSVQLISARLRSQQERVAGIVDGLDDNQLRRPVLPSGWSCLGMVRHLTEGTRFWLRRVMLDETATPLVDDDFVVAKDVSARQVLQDFEQVCGIGLAGVAHLPGGAPPAWWPEGLWGGWRLHDLDEVMVHLLVEISTHAGHLDAARELLDGSTWDYARGRIDLPAKGRPPLPQAGSATHRIGSP